MNVVNSDLFIVYDTVSDFMSYAASNVDTVTLCALVSYLFYRINVFYLQYLLTILYLTMSALLNPETIRVVIIMPSPAVSCKTHYVIHLSFFSDGQIKITLGIYIAA